MSQLDTSKRENRGEMQKSKAKSSRDAARLRAWRRPGAASLSLAGFRSIEKAILESCQVCAYPADYLNDEDAIHTCTMF